MFDEIHDTKEERIVAIRSILFSISTMTGTRVDLLDHNGELILSINEEGEDIERGKRNIHREQFDFAQLSSPLIIDSTEEKGAKTCLLPMGQYIIALSDFNKRRRENKLMASIKSSLPLIAKIVGGEGVIFDDDGLRLINVDGNGEENILFNNRISRYALQAMCENRVVIGPSTSTPGAMAVRLPITKEFGLGFNNEQAVIQKIKLQEQINRNKVAKYTFEDIIGDSVSMMKAKERAEKASHTNSTILLCGETGTGKEVFAHAIHNASIRSDKPFVAINCGAIPSSLIESTLFGYVKGAFTGANSEGHSGFLEQADGGTLLLDEISEMEYNLQARLLRVLEDREVLRIGSKKPIKVDVKIIASTNKDLDQMVEEGKFRQDLLFRLDVVRVTIPPLREHREDILPLTRLFIQQLNRTLNTYILDIEERAAKALVSYTWPGNVRELKNCIEVALNTAAEDTITLNDLPYRLWKNIDSLNETNAEQDDAGLNLKNAMEQMEKQYLLRVLSSVKGNRQKAAKILGISKVTLWRKLHV
jgi:sigma-54 dependent transcriptional regulator, acetoin dehydrogenase operon transcriptional activator AcoR